MINQRLLLKITFLAMLISFGCKDDGANTQVNVPVKKVQSLVSTNGGLTSYDYTADGKVSKVSTSGGYYEIYKYAGDSGKVISINTSGSAYRDEHTFKSIFRRDSAHTSEAKKEGRETATYSVSVSFLTFNAQGYITQIKYRSSSGTVSTQTFEYDKDGYLSKYISTSGSSVSFANYTWTNGNLSTVIYSTGTAYTYTYETEKENTLGNLFGGIDN
ncbi:MAG: hypothetical protein QM536_09520, partial [Chitinophagaceae bacterium]|nr:hypothetical protein [Chitinophagaceae bacterium]